VAVVNWRRDRRLVATKKMKDTIISSLASLVAILIALAGLIPLVILTARFGEYRLKVDTMWNFLMQRAKVAGLENGILTANSPLRVSDTTRAAFGDLLIGQMRAVYKQMRAKGPVTDHDLTLQLQRSFGKQISEDVCPPMQMHLGECLIAAAILCREVDGSEGELTQQGEQCAA
jgi:hypothetical protein